MKASTYQFVVILPLLFIANSLPNEALPLNDSLIPTGRMGVGETCVSITNCDEGLVCVVGNPLGTCEEPDAMAGLSNLIVNIIQLDYTIQPGEERVTPQQGGPTATSRAMTIIYLSAHDTYALCTGDFRPRITRRILRLLQRRSNTFESDLQQELGSSRGSTDGFQSALRDQCRLAALAAGYSAAELFYSRSRGVIEAVKLRAISNAVNGVEQFGRAVASAWESLRRNDGSNRSQLDNMFTFEPLRHQPDPNYNIVTNRPGSQPNFGRFWGTVDPFIVNNIETDLFLSPFPRNDSSEYRANLREVRTFGQCNSLTVELEGNDVLVNDLGTFWGYDGMPGVGVPPRLYLQVVLSVQELYDLSFENQLRVLTAVNAAMADAGIAAWLWKFRYDLWRPVLGIRQDTVDPDEDWSPFGVPFSNIDPDTVPMCTGLNPDFPAYPSGHSSFGTAAFQTLAELLGMNARDIRLTFTSDEFNGVTVDGVTNAPRRVFTQRFTLEDCITQNQDSRVFNGVHWRFDSEGGDTIGRQVARRAANEFSLVR
eukprot:GFKZ01001689.1.p1 GENE.GFKZ01001689.1~~GFKZ01001689.1.p1  ORF type:complete len:539 (-),score=40.78 GFKZ01001689.1:364-1980(-)